jgi:hypothetical protein
MRRFPAPWTVETIPGGFKVIDASGQSLAAGGTIAVAAVCNGRMGYEPHSARAGILQQTGNLLAAKPDCFQRCVKFAPQMKKNRAIAAPACAPLGMDAFTRAQYEWGCGLPRRSHSPRR